MNELDRTNVKLALERTTDDINQSVDHPFRQMGYLCATDRRRLLRIPEDAVNGTDEGKRLIDSIIEQHDPYFPSVLPQPGDYDLNTPLSLAMLEKFLSNKELLEPETTSTYTDCPECDGLGTVLWEYSDKHNHTHTMIGTCPICDGEGQIEHSTPTGKMTVKYNMLCQVMDKYLYSESLDWLRYVMQRLGLSVVYIRYTGNSQIFMTADHDIDLLMMQVLYDPDDVRLRQKVYKLM